MPIPPAAEDKRVTRSAARADATSKGGEASSQPGQTK